MFLNVRKKKGRGQKIDVGTIERIKLCEKSDNPVTKCTFFIDCQGILSDEMKIETHFHSTLKTKQIV